MTAHYRQLLLYYRGLILVAFLALVGGTAALSTLFLYVAPLYTSSAKVSLLPTQTELAYSQTFVRSTTINPANLLTQTHVEYLLSREIAAKTVDRLTRELQPSQPPAAAEIVETEKAPGLKQQVAQRFTSFRRNFRRIYNTLNSGKHVVQDPLTDAVLTLQDAIGVEMVEGTYIMQIKVTWDKPEIAALAANLLAEEYVAHLRAQADAASRQLEAALRQEIAKGDSNFTELEDQINALRLARANNFSMMRVIDPAVEPVYPSFPKVIVFTVFSIVGWVMVSAFLVISADTFSSTIKTESDLQRLFGPRALGTLPLRRPKRAKLAELAKMMNLQCNAMPCQGAVTALGSDEECRRLTAVIEVALRRLKGWQKLKVRRLEDSETAVQGQAGGAALQAVPGGRGSQPVIQLGRPLGGRAGAAPTNGVKVTDLGGGAESFSMSKACGFNWVVIGIRPGGATEEALQGTAARLREQGVANIFGVFLKG
ncbi:hypothetical protein [Leisingera sp. ANG-Vp]|uniref:hypothetical protein n=1 Tax=Leisingera sp. ANG-Vp TaxID=1577896 RepID=UPI00057F6FC7|nr:hypothetical protein [Leisingera sp. ANG-Vp]KIC16251.1 hypothetical protein RA20_16845 [Leisingera sp. ANG-Vp]